MTDLDRLCSAHGLEAVTISSSGQPDIEDDEEFQRSFEGITLVLGDRLDKGSGSLLITSRSDLQTPCTDSQIIRTCCSISKPVCVDLPL